MNNNIYKTELHDLGKCIKGLRELFKMSQRRLAKQAGVGRSLIADIEQELRFPNLVTLLKICEVFGKLPVV